MNRSRQSLPTRVLAVAITAAALLISPATAAENPVVSWNEVTTRTVLADTKTATPSASSLYVAIAQAAVYNAAMAIEGTHQPYRSSLTAPAGASLDAAVAAAAHGVLDRLLRHRRGSRPRRQLSAGVDRRGLPGRARGHSGRAGQG